LDLLSSEWHDYRGSGRSEDRLRQPAWLKDFVGRWGFSPAGRPGPDDIEALANLRALIKRMVDRLGEGRAPADRDLAALDRVLARGPEVIRLTRDADGYHQGSVPLRQDWDWVLARIAASFADLLTHGEPERVKVCENPDCGWVFYDESKNRTRRWCEDACGNLMKVRRFRERRKAAPSPRPATAPAEDGGGKA
ncbi:MAG: CGNR zinc finger domain-containing protein, partial [Bacillota bacterium]